MLMSNSLGLLARALLLAVTSLVIATGVVTAHGASSMASDPSPWRIDVQAAHYAHDGWATKKATYAVVIEEHDAGPCAGHTSDGHSPDGCCSIACHASLAMVATENPGTCEPGKFRPAGFSDMLVGRPSDCNDRPPKRS